MSLLHRDWIIKLGHSEVPVAQTLFVLAAAQGLDYVFRPPGSSPIFGLIEAYVPLAEWGAVLLAGSGIGATALWRNWKMLQLLSHVLLTAVYGAFAAGLIVEVFRTGNVTGWSNAVTWAVIGLYNYLWTQVVALQRRVGNLNPPMEF